MVSTEKKYKIQVSKGYTKDDWCDYLNATCYTYALNVFTNERLYVGDIYLNNRVDTASSDDDLIKSLIQEIELFGVTVIKCDRNEKINDDEFLFCMVREETLGYYHFYRLERDGFWTHKKPMELPDNVGYDGNIIYNPEEAVEPGYNRIYYFKVKTNVQER